MSQHSFDNYHNKKNGVVILISSSSNHILIYVHRYIMYKMSIHFLFKCSYVYTCLALSTRRKTLFCPFCLHFRIAFSEKCTHHHSTCSRKEKRRMRKQVESELHYILYFTLMKEEIESPFAFFVGGCDDGGK